MPKFDSLANTRRLHEGVTAPIATLPRPTGLTAQGAPGYERTAQAELYLLAVANFVSEDTFHEAADTRDDRFRELVRICAAYHRDWTARLLRWLRNDANMRSASVVGAAEFVKARLDLGCVHLGCATTSAPLCGPRL